MTKAAAAIMNDVRSCKSSSMARILLGHASPKTPMPVSNLKTPEAIGLNPEQLKALKYSASNTELLCIHGPPGTGKTATLSTIIDEHVRRYAGKKFGSKVLVTCPSNAAVDNLLGVLHKKKMKGLVRLGAIERTDPNVRQYSLKARVLKKRKNMSKKEKAKKENSERALERDILEQASCILATCTIVGQDTVLDCIDKDKVSNRYFNENFKVHVHEMINFPFIMSWVKLSKKSDQGWVSAVQDYHWLEYFYFEIWFLTSHFSIYVRFLISFSSKALLSFINSFRKSLGCRLSTKLVR